MQFDLQCSLSKLVMKVPQYSIGFRKSSVKLFEVLLFITMSALPRISGAVATDLSLQSPMNRTIELQSNVDAQQWASMNDLEDT